MTKQDTASPTAEPLIAPELAKSFDSKLSTPSQAAKAAPKDNRALAITCTNIYAITEVLQSVFFKMGAANGLSPVDFPLFRNVVLFFYAGCQVLYGGKNVSKAIPKHLRFNVFLRCMLGQVHFFLLNLALIYVPLAAVQVIMLTSPFFASIFSYLMLGEPVKAHELVFMAICFSCIILFSVCDKPADGEEAVGAETTDFNMGYLIVIVLAALMGFIGVVTRSLKGVDTPVILFWNGLLGITTSCMLIGGDHLFFHAGEALRLFTYGRSVVQPAVSAAVTDAFCVHAITLGFQSDSTGFVALITYLTVPYGYFADLWIFDEFFTVVQTLAVLVILAIMVGISVHDLRKEAQKKAKAEETVDDDFKLLDVSH